VARESIFYYLVYFYFAGAEGSGGKDPFIDVAEPRFPGIFAITYTASRISNANALGITIE